MPAAAARASSRKPRPAKRAACGSPSRVDEVRPSPTQMLGKTLVTKQTGPDGRQVNRLYIEEGADIARELYLSLLVDRATSRVAFIASTEGGMDIEEVAHETPEKIITRHHRSGDRAIRRSTAARSPSRWGSKGDQVEAVRDADRRRSTRLFIEKDMSLLEINPLIVTEGRRAARASTPR